MQNTFINEYITDQWTTETEPQNYVYSQKNMMHIIFRQLCFKMSISLKVHY